MSDIAPGIAALPLARLRPRFTLRPWLVALLDALRADVAIYALTLLYLVAGAAYVASRGGMLMGAFDIYLHTCFVTYCLILPFIVLVIGIFRITHRLDQRRALAYRYMFAPRRMARFLAGTALMMGMLLPFESMFASIKSTISDTGFPYDKLAADIDKFIHFGRAPVKTLLLFAQNETLLRVVEFNYDIVWFIVCFGILYWMSISPRVTGVRLRYIVSFLLIWVIVGNVAAILFPTAGPAFYDLVTNDPSRFSVLNQFVDSTAGWFASAADEQRYLWTLHAHGESGFGSGISAFPSMHIALIAINAMFVSELGRKAALIAWGYVVVIMLSSIYLGWHYAIDGYAAIVLSAAIYWGVRRCWPLLARTPAGASSASG